MSELPARLMIAGVGYLASSFATLVLPRYAELVEKVAMPLVSGSCRSSSGS